MSSSSRAFGEADNPRVDLPVFVTPIELVFAANKRRCILTIFNPYGNEAQFRIMTTSPDRFDVSATKGVIKPSRRVDITIRLLSHQIEELPEPTEELQTIDYFRVSIQVGQLKGNKPVKVNWCSQAELFETSDTGSPLLSVEDKQPKSKVKSTRPISGQSPVILTGSSCSSQRNLPIQRPSNIRLNRQVDRQLEPGRSGSDVNLVCTLCAIACVFTLFLPLAIDTDLCKKSKSYINSTEPIGLLSQLASFLSVGYEVKLGCSFALGLFTYRLISTLPD